MAKCFKETAMLWLSEKRKYVKISTVCVYKASLISHIIPWFDKAKSISEKDVQEFVLYKLENGLSQKTVKDIVIIIKMIGKFARKNRIMKVEDFEVIYPKDFKKKRMEILSRENERKLIEHLKANKTAKNIGLLICIGTGIRIGEICGLKWSDVDLELCELNIQRTVQRVYLNNNKEKTRLIINEPKTISSKRSIPLCKMLIGFLKPLKEYEKEQFYVLTDGNDPMEPRIYRNYFDSILKELAIPKIKFHGIRHTFATRCIEASSDYKAISSILGHSNITTTLNLYVHPDSMQKQRCIENMLKFLNC